MNLNIKIGLRKPGYSLAMCFHVYTILTICIMVSHKENKNKMSGRRDNAGFNTGNCGMDLNFA